MLPDQGKIIIVKKNCRGRALNETHTIKSFSFRLKKWISQNSNIYIKKRGEKERGIKAKKIEKNNTFSSL